MNTAKVRLLEAPNEPKIMLYYDTGPEQCLHNGCTFPSEGCPIIT